jgi:hypothetical protein
MEYIVLRLLIRYNKKKKKISTRLQGYHNPTRHFAWDGSYKTDRLWDPPSGRNAQFATYLHLVPTLGIKAAILPLPLYVLIVWLGNIPFL